MKLKKWIIAIVVLVIVIIGGRILIKDYFFPYAHKDAVIKYSKEYNLDPLFVLSVMKAESGFNPNATSHKNAVGLMQITKETGTWIAEQMKMENFNVNDLYNENTNIEMGCWYLNDLFKEFKNRDLVLAAYNGGRGNVQKWLYDFRYSSNGELINIPFKETQDYVKKVNSDLEVYSRIYSNK